MTRSGSGRENPNCCRRPKTDPLGVWVNIQPALTVRSDVREVILKRDLSAC